MPKSITLHQKLLTINAQSISMINLISDTITQPTPAMLEAMMTAKVGDDVFGEDPTINALEAKAATMFGMEAALFCPSGTMTNQLAIKAHTQPMEEVICEEKSHIYQSEVGGYAFHSGIAVSLIKGENGIINVENIEAAIKPHYDWLPRTTLVSLENTSNFGGGSYYTINQVKPIQDMCKRRGLKLHLDGARLFNALVETGESTLEWGATFDSISICLSKGLGAPVGSLLLGNQHFIQKSRRYRKAFGGGMRQAGFLAAACIYALDNNIGRLKEDNDNARKLGEILRGLSYVENIRPVKTNIVIFDVKTPLTATSFLEKIDERGMKAAAFGPQTVRFVTHLHFTTEMLADVKNILVKIM
jgi:threonine aldolase